VHSAAPGKKMATLGNYRSIGSTELAILRLLSFRLSLWSPLGGGLAPSGRGGTQVQFSLATKSQLGPCELLSQDQKRIKEALIKG